MARSAVRLINSGSFVPRAERFDGVHVDSFLDLRLAVDGRPCRLVNISDTGLAFETPSSDFNNDQVVAVRLTVGEQNLLFEGKAEVKRIGVENGATACGLRFTSGALGQDVIQALETAWQLRCEIAESERRLVDLPAKFVTFIHSYRSYLMELKSRFTLLEEQFDPSQTTAWETQLRAIELVFLPYVTAGLRRFNQRFVALQPELHGAGVRERAVRLFAHEITPFFASGHGRERDAKAPRTTPGHSLFSAVTRHLGINRLYEQSARFRWEALQTSVRDFVAKARPFTAGVFGVEAGLELIQLLAASPRDVTARSSVVIIEEDMSAMVEWRRAAEALIQDRKLELEVELVPFSARGFVERAAGMGRVHALKFDLIVAFGYYSLLPQGIARYLTDDLLRQLKPEGRLLVGDLNPQSLQEFTKDIAFEWPLERRGEKELAALVPKEAGLLASFQTDPAQLDLIMCVERS